MLPIQINDAEWELFAGEPASYFKLYCFLKRHMDFSTGIAGVKTRINDVAIRNVFMVDPVPGRHASDPLKRGVWRSALRRINKIGALKTIAPNVFQFPPSVCITPFKTGRTKEEPCDAPQDAAATSAPRALRLVASNTFEGLKESQGAPEDEQMRDPLLISSSTSSCAQAAEPVERFWMHPAWIPAADTWHALLGSYGVDPAECTPDRLGSGASIGSQKSASQSASLCLRGSGSTPLLAHCGAMSIAQPKLLRRIVSRRKRVSTLRQRRKTQTDRQRSRGLSGGAGGAGIDSARSRRASKGRRGFSKPWSWLRAISVHVQTRKGEKT